MQITNSKGEVELDINLMDTTTLRKLQQFVKRNVPRSRRPSNAPRVPMVATAMPVSTLGSFNHGRSSLYSDSDSSDFSESDSSDDNTARPVIPAVTTSVTSPEREPSSPATPVIGNTAAWSSLASPAVTAAAAPVDGDSSWKDFQAKSMEKKAREAELKLQAELAEKKKAEAALKAVQDEQARIQKEKDDLEMERARKRALLDQQFGEEDTFA